MTEWLMVAVGGLLIGSAAAAFLFINGRILGVSGLFGNVVSRSPAWRSSIALVSGLAIGGLILRLTGLLQFEMGVPRSLPIVLLAGLLVGFGTRLSNGCTSGHGICGVARLSRRSLAATAIFMATGIVTVWVTRQFGWFP